MVRNLPLLQTACIFRSSGGEAVEERIRLTDRVPMLPFDTRTGFLYNYQFELSGGSHNNIMN